MAPPTAAIPDTPPIQESPHIRGCGLLFRLVSSCRGSAHIVSTYSLVIATVGGWGLIGVAVRARRATWAAVYRLVFIVGGVRVDP